jgi:hypothetical protein
MYGRMSMGQGGIADDVPCICLAFEIEKRLHEEKDGVDREQQSKKDGSM